MSYYAPSLMADMTAGRRRCPDPQCPDPWCWNESTEELPDRVPVAGWLDERYPEPF